MASSLPSLPSLQELGIPVSEVRGNVKPNRPGTQKQQYPSKNRTSDGSKRVNYQSPNIKNVRPYQQSKFAKPVELDQPVSSEITQRNLSQNIPKLKPKFQKKDRPGQKSSAKTVTKKEYPQLKISPYGDALIQYIRAYPILALVTPTGSGKTRYVPYRATLEGWKVRVAIPTTVAVRDAARFQRDHSMLSVGYAAGREIKYSTSDQLVYGTTGHFNQKILQAIRSNKNKPELVISSVIELLGHLFVIDEVHTNTSQITMLIGLLRYLFFQNGVFNGPHLLLSTATFNHGDLIDHFADFPIYEPPELQATFPVTPIFLSIDRNLLLSDPNAEIIRIIGQELVSWKNSSQKFHGIVFRPGIQEVEMTIQKLEQAFPIHEPIDFYPAYGGMIQADLDRIFEPSNRMKVIVGTNIIESSVTIDDVAFVIDDMLEKIAETSSTGGQKLSLVPISKAASKQRSGRTGRTLPGRYYPLITLAAYNNLTNYREKEIQRVPIFDLVLQLLDAGLNPQEILKINVAKYDQAQSILQKFGMVQPRAEGYEVTKIGRFASSLSLGIQNSYMIYLGVQRYREGLKLNPGSMEAEKILLRSVIAIACMLEVYGPNFFYIPRKTREQSMIEYNALRDSHIEKYHEKFRGATDIHTLVNLFWQMMADINVVKTYESASKYKFTNYVKNWCQENSMNNRKVQEYLTVMKDVESTVQASLKGTIQQTTLRSELPTSGKSSIYALGKNLPDGGFHDIGSLVAKIFAKAYSTNSLKKVVGEKGKVSYIQPETGLTYKINKNSTFSQLELTKENSPAEIVVAQTIEVADRNSKVHLAGIVVSSDYFNYSPETVEQLVPELVQKFMEEQTAQPIATASSVSTVVIPESPGIVPTIVSAGVSPSISVPTLPVIPILPVTPVPVIARFIPKVELPPIHTGPTVRIPIKNPPFH